ncbi:MAG: AAA family ATPase [Myxococcales bacterium]|nr:AAA family ATPase [Myxococcales bacterium]
MSTDLGTAARAVRTALDRAAHGLVDRHVLVDLVALAAVAGEHLLVLGPPGTAKSQAVRQVARALGGRYFEYLLGRFTEPSELVGPIDLRRLRDGVVETHTAGMLPEAEVAFLDEVFLGSTAILNTLLSLLNERTFRRGATAVAVPLRVCVGAANQLPDDEALAAFADRFLLRCFVAPVGDAQLEELLEGGWQVEQAAVAAAAGLAELDRLATAARAADLGAVRPRLAEAVRTLRGVGVALSDRRVVKLQRLIAAAAALDGRTAATAADLWPIVYAVPTAEGQAQARDALRGLLEASASAALGAAAAEASMAAPARAARLVAAARALLADEVDAPGRALRLESVVREIDAGFDAAARPDELTEARGAIVAALAQARAADDGGDA